MLRYQELDSEKGGYLVVPSFALLQVVRHINGRAFLPPEQRVAKGWTATLRFVA